MSSDGAGLGYELEQVSEKGVKGYISDGFKFYFLEIPSKLLKYNQQSSINQVNSSDTRNNEIKLQPVHEGDWSYLIILDACRFDVFKQEYSDFLEGKLKKVWSRGSATPEWLAQTFDSPRYNLKYISANVFVNQSGFRLDSGWYAADKFTEVREAWREKWSHENNTVLPSELTDYSLSEIESGDRAVIHFVQPHRPFISSGDDEYTQRNAERLKREQEDDAEEKNDVEFDNSIHRALWSFRPVWKPVFDRFPDDAKEEIRDLLGISVRSDLKEYEKLVEKKGLDAVKGYYRQDLRLALKQVSSLVESLDGDVVVTADHGEAWGENGEWSHPVGSENPVLREVPWLEVGQR